MNISGPSIASLGIEVQFNSPLLTRLFQDFTLLMKLVEGDGFKHTSQTSSLASS